VNDPPDRRRQVAEGQRPKKDVSKSATPDALPLSFLPLGLFIGRSEGRSLGTLMFESKFESERTTRFYRSAAWKLSGRSFTITTER